MPVTSALQRQALALAAVVLAALACRDPNAPCQSNSDCREDELCVLERCRTVCTSNQQCKRTEVCRDGICWPDEPASDAAAASDGGNPDRDSPDRIASDHLHPDQARTDQARTDQSPADGAPGDRQTDAADLDAAADSAIADLTRDVGANDGAADRGAPDSGPCAKPALSFDGDDDYFEVGDDPAFDGLGALTVEAWVNTPVAIGANTRMRIISHHSASTYDGYALAIYYGGASFFVGHGGTYLSAEAPFATYPFVPNVWHHVAGTYDGSTVRVFVDGVLQDEASCNNGPSDFTGPLTAGTGAADRSYFYAGLLDEVRISRTARYTGSFTPPTALFVADADTVVLWHANEGSGEVVADAVEAQHNATLGSGPGVDSHDPTWVTATCIHDRR
ncbi:MAG: LamG domain-containing protein [Deltaproteobacteria bacterium]|nr:LamG domain-containing protein [Deltaproteobacteria bacterium]